METVTLIGKTVDVESNSVRTFEIEGHGKFTITTTILSVGSDASRDSEAENPSFVTFENIKVRKWFELNF